VLVRLPPERAAVRRLVRELWLPYDRDLAGVVASHDLAEDADLVAEQTDFRLERLAEDDHRVWVAVGVRLARPPRRRRPLHDRLGFEPARVRMRADRGGVRDRTRSG
jgi:hypothetical protein